MYEPLGKTQDPERIAAGGGGLCSEAALVLNALARRGGRQARLIHLHGHVVSEIRTKEGWRVADPDFGVVFPGPSNPRLRAGVGHGQPVELEAGLESSCDGA